MSVLQNDVVGSPPAADPEGGCRCSTSTEGSPACRIVVVRVAGEIDLSSVGVLVSALTLALGRRPDQIVVDLAGVTYCGCRGLAVLVETFAAATEQGTRFALSGVSARVERRSMLLWPADQFPVRYPTAQVGVVVSLADRDPVST